MEINGEGYDVRYDQGEATVICSGSFDLRGKEGYGEIVKLLGQVVDEGKPIMNLDLREVEFLNSSGITTLGGFIIKLRDKKVSRLCVLCSSKYTWQSRSMRGLQKLMPDMSIEFE